jgi:hypothetical protein
MLLFKSEVAFVESLKDDDDFDIAHYTCRA